MAAELFMAMTKTKMQHVPYKGSSDAHPDVLSGRVVMIFDPVPAIRAHVKSGSLRGIAVTTTKRSSAFPELPTIAETLPGYDASTWGGILAPAGTPKDVVAKLNAVDQRRAEDGRRALQARGRGDRDPGRHARAVRQRDQGRSRKVGQVVKEAGIQPE